MSSSEPIRGAVLDAHRRLRPAESPGAVLGSEDLRIRANDGSLHLFRAADGNIGLLVPAGTRIPSDLPTATEGVDIGLQRLRTSPASPVDAHLLLTCRRKTLESVFLDLVIAIAEAVDRRAEDAALTAIRVFRRWRELLHDAPRPMSAAATAGLIGELLIVAEVIELTDISFFPDWRGPFRDRHDLVHDTHALEIKTTTANELTAVRINGINQLDAPLDGTLHLIAIRLSPDHGDLTVDTLVRRLTDAGVDGTTLRRMLRLLGANPSDTSPFALEERHLYVVDERFPRIVPSSFAGARTPPGVSELSYRVSLPAPVENGSSVTSVWLSTIARA